MRILVCVHQFFPRHYGGTERFVLNLTSQLQRLGHSPVVLAYGLGERSGFFDRSTHGVVWTRRVWRGIPVIYYAPEVMTRALAMRLSYNLRIPELAPFAEKILEILSPDVVHVAHPVRTAEIAYRAMSEKVPTVVTLTDFWLICPRVQMLRVGGARCSAPRRGSECVESGCIPERGRGWICSRFEQAVKFLDRVGLVLSPSRFLARRIEASTGRTGLVQVVRHGVDIPESVPRQGSRTSPRREPVGIGYIGTLQPHKGVDVAVKALRSIDSNDIRLIVYGDSSSERSYGKYLRDLAAGDDRISFPGVYRQGELSGILGPLDFTVCPSVCWENAPFAIALSFAYRVPVVASDIGGMAELVTDNENGLTFPAGDVSGLAEVFKKILENPDLASTLRERIQVPASNADEGEGYASLYNELTQW